MISIAKGPVSKTAGQVLVVDDAVVRQVEGLGSRPDGNNGLEREGLLLAETQLRFQTGVQLLKAEFHRILSAIREGG